MRVYFYIEATVLNFYSLQYTDQKSILDVFGMVNPEPFLQNFTEMITWQWHFALIDAFRETTPMQVYRSNLTQYFMH